MARAVREGVACVHPWDDPMRPLVLAILVLGTAPVRSAVAQAEEPIDARAAWRGGILLDEDARDALRLGAPADQEIAATASDVLLATTMLDAAGIDAFGIPLARRDPVLAWRASAAHVLGLGLTVLLGEIIKGAAGRARPFERECRAAPSDARCRASDTFASFYSLHAGVAFASAGTSCALHASRALYEDLAADALSCALSLALATTTGLLRVASDRHYLSDVVVGGVLGFIAGYLAPLLLVPERGAPAIGAIGLGSVQAGVSGAF